MSEKDIPFVVAQGAMFSAEINVAPGGTAIDWNTGYYLDGQLRKDPSETATASFVFTPDLSAPPTGNNSMTLNTSAIPVGKYSYSVRLRNDNLSPVVCTTLFKGEFVVRSSPTRSS